LNPTVGIGSNFQLADKSLAVKFKKHWKILAEFNSDSTTSNARQREFSQKSKWRREGDSNPRYDFWPYTGLANQRLQPLGHLSKTVVFISVYSTFNTAKKSTT
jgi:hypothetical protein